jgi:putative ABC transport system permease protein
LRLRRGAFLHTIRAAMIMLRDFWHAARGLAARPGMALVIIATIALGTGANAAVFSVVDALLLRPLPYRDADRLVRVGSVKGGDEGTMAYPELADVAALHDVIDDVAAYTDQGQYNASGDGPPEELPSTITTHNIFRVLGMPPFIGRTWPDTYDRSRHFSVVISDGLWERRFGRDPGVLKKAMTLDGAEGYEIVGVAPPNLTFPSRSDLFRSIGIAADPAAYERRDRRYVWLVARLRGAVTYAQAQDSLDRLAMQLERTYPATNTGIGFRLTPLRDLYVGNVRPYLLLLAGGVAFVLLLACANVANLLLSKAIGRQRELAVRHALGATRSDLVRQLFAESIVLAVLGAAAGAGVAALGIRLLTTVIDLRLPAWMTIALDWRVLFFLAVAAALTALLAGLIPAIRLSRPDLAGDLKESARATTGGVHHRRLRYALLVCEVALVSLLLVGAGLMLQTVWKLQRVKLGFEPDHLLTFRVELGWKAYDTLEKSTRFYTRAIEMLAARADVESVAIDSNLALSGKPRDPSQVVVAGQSSDEQAENPFVSAHWISPQLFATMRIPLVAGRAFTDDDRANTGQVAIINERMAARLFPGARAIGRQIRFSTAAAGTWMTIVGVAANVRHQDVAAAPGYDVYVPYRQSNVSGVYYVVRTKAAPMPVAGALPSIVWGIDPNQSFFDVRSMDDRLATILWHQRAAGWLFGCFAALALVLAASGLYAELAYTVSQQQRELAVRIALGASRLEIVSLVFGRSLLLVATGLGIGLAGAASVAQLTSSLLFGVGALDPRTFVAVPLVLAVVAAVAAYVPVRRATRVDPLIALRAE